LFRNGTFTRTADAIEKDDLSRSIHGPTLIGSSALCQAEADGIVCRG
jgi:hypothetical protein